MCKFVSMYTHFVAVECFAVEGDVFNLDATHGVFFVKSDKCRFGNGDVGAVGQDLNIFEAYVANAAVLAVL